jgi:hypothetical protein
MTPDIIFCAEACAMLDRNLRKGLVVTKGVIISPVKAPNSAKTLPQSSIDCPASPAKFIPKYPPPIDNKTIPTNLAISSLLMSIFPPKKHMGERPVSVLTHGVLAVSAVKLLAPIHLQGWICRHIGKGPCEIRIISNKTRRTW